MSSLISFVVDGIAEHYYRTELLLFSLEKFGAVPRNRILVQCVDRVAPKFLAFLQDNGYTYRIIPPFLDGKYCNKLQQLEGIEPYLGEADGVYLLDTDLAILAPFDVPDQQAVCGKIVDLPNPPLHVLERIFTAAGLALPAATPSDCAPGLTLSTNFNGGFLFIPREHIPALSREWRSQATWLYARPELFESAQQFIHVDQVALALAIAALSLRSALLPSNLNLPLHLQSRPASFDTAAPIRVLHYHRQINPFGLLSAAFPDQGMLDAAAASINAALTTHGTPRFFDAYKLEQSEAKARMVRQHAQNSPLRQLFANRKLDAQPRRRLILHAGTPKTGTTSLQFFLDENRDMLRSHGILYPTVHTRLSAEPKHQWLAIFLAGGNALQLSKEFEAVLNELTPDIHTVILSTEGIFNHWWDIAPAALAPLAALADWFDVQTWLWLREPVSFMKSYYLQKLCNPRNEATRCNGVDMDMDEMLRDEWVVRHLDYLGFIRDAQALFGKGSVRALPYTGNTIADAMRQLGLPHNRSEEARRHNVSLGELGVNLMRVVNRYELSHPEKVAAVDLIKQLDASVANKTGPFEPGEAARAYISACYSLQGELLRQEFNLAWQPATHPAPATATAPARTLQAPPKIRARFF